MGEPINFYVGSPTGLPDKGAAVISKSTNCINPDDCS